MYDGSSLLVIYASCSKLILLKRNIFSRLIFPSFPQPDQLEAKRLTSAKLSICMNKILKEITS
jgi:hypothetical protein